jgi:chromosomal replication initiator protein
VKTGLAGAETLWSTCAGVLRSRLPEGTWNTLFASARAVGGDDHFLVLSVPSAVVKDRIETRHLALLEDVCTEVGGHQRRVVLQVDTEAGMADGDTTPPEAVAGATKADDDAHSVPARGSGAGGSGGGPGGRPVEAGPNPKYTFETFVSGSSNRFALAAATNVAEKPARSFNPLFIYGGAGLGKTHLLHAIGNYVREHYPNLNVIYASAETFTNDFVESIRTNTQFAFKQRYRTCDVLLIDDIQFLERKEGTKEEFFHTFNTLHEDDRQIVITSDRAPKNLAAFEDRLRTRIDWGLTTDVQPPDLETRLAILRRKAEQESIPLPDEVLEYIGTNITDNIRELEGALIRVAAYASIHQVPATRTLAEEQLRDLINNETRQVTPRMILEATAEMFGLTIEDLVGKSRSRPLVTARQVAMYVVRQMTDFSYPAIGREFGGRDHTTVMHAVDKIGGLMKERRAIFDQVTALMQRLGSGA